MERSLGKCISRRRKEKGLTQGQLAEKMRSRGYEITNKVISNWEKDIYEPGIYTFLALCDILGIDDIQWEFAGLHRGILSGLNEEGRKKARDFTDILFHVDKYRDDPPNEQDSSARLLRLYSIGVSAGTGSFLDDSDYEMIEAPYYVPSAADFALRVSGDSMEPLLGDRQIIWVQESPVLDSGDIGVFFYDDSSYCKKYIHSHDGVILRSLNEKYGDIIIDKNSSFKILGKVIA